MHEFNIIQNIFSILQQEAAKNHIKRVNSFVLQLGKLRQCNSDFLRFAFAIVAKGTIAEGANMVIKEIEIEVLCEECKNRFIVRDDHYVCPICKNFNCKILTGNEIILATIEGEQNAD